MKIIFTLLFILCFSSLYAQQTIIYDGHGQVIGGSHIKSVPPQKVILTDDSTNTKFELDSTHIYITAYDKAGKILWKTDPWKDNNISAYRTNRPIIVNMVFTRDQGYLDKLKKGQKIIWIDYINTQFGFIDLKTGKFYFMGQD